ncbi:hypothetical protein ABIA16_003845 [Sinorhizobium fredii]
MAEQIVLLLITGLTVIGIAAIFALLQHLRATVPTDRRKVL